MTELITVSAARQDGRVALWERHPDHPGGEVFVAADSGRVQVARTPAVQAALTGGRLLEHLRPAVPVVAPEPEPAPVADRPSAPFTNRRKAAKSRGSDA